MTASPDSKLTHRLNYVLCLPIRCADEHNPRLMSPATWEEMADPADEYLQVPPRASSSTGNDACNGVGSSTGSGTALRAGSNDMLQGGGSM